MPGKKMPENSKNSGYTLIEIMIVIIIIGIITSIALKSLDSTNDIARVEETRKELDRLAEAVAGRTDLVSGGDRIDYGYVGDIGAMPPDLDALLQNPGGFTTWKGPYIRTDFSSDGGSEEIKKDAWGVNYLYSGGTDIISTGGGSAMTRQIAESVDALLYNRAILVTTDLDRTPPGSIYRDSIRLILQYPDGAGGYTYKNETPDNNGLTVFDSIPIGLHELRVVYLPENDTLIRQLNIAPGSELYTEITLFKDVW